jgi:hypothetical protein
MARGMAAVIIVLSVLTVLSVVTVVTVVTPVTRFMLHVRARLRGPRGAARRRPFVRERVARQETARVRG